MNKLNYLKQAWLVLVLAICFGAGLAGVQVALSGRIEANKLKETLSQIPLLVPGAEKGEKDEKSGVVVYKALKGDEIVGWVVPASGQGFADKIEVLIGFTKDFKKLTGMYVLDQKETPGLGNKIIDEAFRKQFIGKDTSFSLNVVKTNDTKDNNISAVTGATISSVSVCGIIDSTIKKLQIN